MSTENHTALPDNWEVGRFPVSLMQIRACLLILCMLVGVVGNLLTLVAVGRCPRLHNATTAFIVSLGVSDLMFCVLVIPPEIVHFSRSAWLQGDGALCVIQTFFEYICVATSLFSISLITLNRFVLIVFPSAYQRLYQRRWVAGQITAIWVFSFIMLIPTLSGTWGRFDYQPRLRSCAIVPVDGRSSNITLFFIGFLVPCVVISIGYFTIFATVMASSRHLLRHGPAHESEATSRRAQRRRRNEMRLTIMSLAIFVTFIACFSPLTFANVVDDGYEYPEWHVTGYVMVCVSSCINPLIYVTLSREYRQAYWTLLRCGPIRHGSESSTVSVAARNTIQRRSPELVFKSPGDKAGPARILQSSAADQQAGPGGPGAAECGGDGHQRPDLGGRGQ